MTTRLAVLACALALGAALGVQGCAQDRAAIQIQALCYPDESCGGDGGCGALLTGVPMLKGTTSGSSRFVVLLQVENQLPNNADLDLGRLNTNDAHVDGAAIEFEDGAAPSAEIHTNSWIAAGSISTVLAWIPVPAGTAAGTKVAQLRLRGYLDDGTRFETGDFAITFEYCTTCTIVGCGAEGVLCPPGATSQEPVVCNPTTTP
jgi:hypothetical protein